ncbi:MAG: class I SAM-dependent methyltransferase, partial [Deltaproteobacteria bacterium]|nr:class I SAM-dependent methyltransferase [Deltaproteobacteria bacterium]
MENKNELKRLEEQSASPDYDVARELADDLPPSGARILDAGCGSGVVARFLARRDPSCKVTGCDFVPDRVAGAAELAKGIGNVEFRVEDLRRISLPDASFDYVVCRYMLQHLEADAR